MDQPNKISVGDLQRKLEAFTSWSEMIKEPIQEEEEVNKITEPTIDILPIPLTEEEKLLVESATEEVKIINVEAVTESTAPKEEDEKEPCETELMPLTEIDKDIIEQVEQIIAPVKSKRTKQKLVTDDKPSPVIKSNVKAKLPKPKTITLAANQVLQIKLPVGQTTCQIEFV